MTENDRTNVSQGESAPVDKSGEKSANDIFAKGEAIAKRMEEANKKAEELIDRQEALAVKKSFDGSSETGIEPPKEESPQDYAKKALQGVVPKESNND